MTGQVLFLCSGNYYRSRFAELLFNARAEQRGLIWRAESRGLGVGRSELRNPGAISPHALNGLRQRGLAAPASPRDPLAPCLDDFAACRVIIALQEDEHRPLIREHFPTWEHHIEYWHVHDVDQCAPDEALPEIERLVDRLIERLAAEDASGCESKSA